MASRIKAPPMKALAIAVKGRVQRVGYRRYVLDVAQEEGVSGTIKNLPDGSVSIFAQGTARQLGSFLKKARNPPPPAKVKESKVAEARARAGAKAFLMLSSGLAEEMQEGFGAMQSEFSDYRQEFRRFSNRTDANFKELGDRTDANFRSLGEKTDANFKELGGKFDGFATQTDSNFKALDGKYGEISEKLSQVLAALSEQAKRSQEMLESMREEAGQTARALNESLKLLREAVDRFPKAT